MRNMGDAELQRRSIDGRLLDVRTSMVGEVVSFDANTMTATIRPGVRVQVVDSDTNPPELDTLDVLEAVPVLFPHCGNFILYHPISEGDIGRLEWSEEDDSEAYTDGSASVPVNPRVLKRHGGTAVFRPEGFRGTGALGGESSAHGFLGFPDGVGVQVRTGELRLGGSDATDPVVRQSDLQAVIDALNTHTHGGVTAGMAATAVPTPLFSPASGSNVVKAK